MTFSRALGHVLEFEGGFADHKNDKGGRTMCGVTQKSYTAWRNKMGLSPKDVALIESDEVNDIYFSEYWHAGNCDALPWPLSLVHFDACVNHGLNRAALLLQDSLGVKVDGIIGPKTLSAAIACQPMTTAYKHCDVREKFYHRIVEKDRTQETFLRGWLRRLDKLRGIIQQAWIA